MNDFLLQYGKLYHFSPEANRESILQNGILPSRDNYKDSDFHPATNGDNRAMVCMCHQDQIADYIRTQRGYSKVDPFVCGIDVKRLVDLRIGLDWTVWETIDLFQGASVRPFVQVFAREHVPIAIASLMTLRTLVCFDTIPITAFSIREALEFVEPRPPSFDDWERATRPPQKPTH